jgi:hypothetical protein
MNVGNIWNSQTNDATMKPPRPNKLSEVPFNRLVYNLDYLGNLYNAVPIDRGLAELIDKKTTPFQEGMLREQRIELILLGHKDQFKIVIWIIPIFYDGILVSSIFAANDVNQQLILEHRSVTKTGKYGITDPF